MTGRLVPGRLMLVATPIGNLGDLQPRAIEVLAAADLVCCEDTRRTGLLLHHAGIKMQIALEFLAQRVGVWWLRVGKEHCRAGKALAHDEIEQAGHGTAPEFCGKGQDGAERERVL